MGVVSFLLGWLFLYAGFVMWGWANWYFALLVMIVGAVCEGLWVGNAWGIFGDQYKKARPLLVALTVLGVAFLMIGGVLVVLPLMIAVLLTSVVFVPVMLGLGLKQKFEADTSKKARLGKVMFWIALVWQVVTSMLSLVVLRGIGGNIAL